MFARTLQNRTRTFVSRYSMLLSGVIGDPIFVREQAFVFRSVRENVRKNATEPNKNIRQSIFFASFGSDRRSYEQNYVTPCIVRLRLHSGILIFQRRRFSKCEKKFSLKIANVRWNILKCDDRKILLEQGGKIKYFPTSNNFRKN